MTERILVFEDKEENFTQLEASLSESVDSDRFVIDRFDGSDRISESQETIDFVKGKLQSPRYPILVILDWDLSQFSNSVNREHVQRACDELDIPRCEYHRDEGYFKDAEQLTRFDEDVIKIRPRDNLQEVGGICSKIAQGFADIRVQLEEHTGEFETESAITEILSAPSAAESKLDQYSWGQSKIVTRAREDPGEEELVRVATTYIGYWVFNQLLEFPGVLLNEIATSSYLGVDEDQFASNEELQVEFQVALYDGPFSGLNNWWWMPKLDEIRANNTDSNEDELVDGPELISRLGEYEIEPVHCTESHSGAGYYCIIREEPVCKDDSVRPTGWIPIGASRSRITEEEYHKISAWMPE